MNQDQAHMSRALELARLGRYSVSPNPMVGCVIVKDGQVIGEGYHHKAGEAHAEIIALKVAGEKARGATLYVTLEPCCHTGRTPPCVNTLISAGIAKVFVACPDPNPLVSGKGIAALREAGIAVEVGLEEEAASHLNEIFFQFIQSKRPFVIAKWAMSLDGETMTHPEDAREISGSESQRRVHDLRQRVDAILVGAETVRKDNPLLTARIHLQSGARQPLRIVLSRLGDLPQDLNVFDPHLEGKTLLVLPSDPALDAVAELWQTRGIQVWRCALLDGQFDLSALLTELGSRAITSVLVEGGEHTRRAFFEADLIHRVEVFVAPVLIEGFAQKHRLQEVTFERCGEDFHYCARLV